MSCRQAQGSPGKQEQHSGELWILVTPLVPVTSPNVHVSEMIPSARSPCFFGSSSSSVALRKTSPRVHPTYSVRVIHSLLMSFPQAPQITVQMQVKWGDIKDGGCEAESDDFNLLPSFYNTEQHSLFQHLLKFVLLSCCSCHSLLKIVLDNFKHMFLWSSHNVPWASLQWKP